MLSALPPAKVEQMKRSMVAPVWHAIPHIIDALEEKPLEAGTKADEAGAILSSFTVPDSLKGRTP